MIAISGTPDTKTSLLLRSADVIPRFEDALPQAMTKPEKTEHQAIDGLQDTGWEDEDRCPVEVHG